MPIHGAAAPKPATADFAPYGSDAPGISALTRTDATLSARVHPALAIRPAEVVWHAREEMARTVEDVLARRTRSLVLDARSSIAAAPAVARLLARELRRDAAWIDGQVAAFAGVARQWMLSDAGVTNGARGAVSAGREAVLQPT